MKTCVNCNEKKPKRDFLSRRGWPTARCSNCRGNVKAKVWQNSEGRWCRNCPKCHKIVSYHCESATCLAVENKTLCYPCSVLVRPKHRAPKAQVLPIIDLAEPKLEIGSIRILSVKVGVDYHTIPIPFITRHLKCKCGWERVMSIPLNFDG